MSDDKSQALFNTIAQSTGQHSILIKKMHLSTKQYYSRISGLTTTGLIKRNQGKYSLTPLGRVVHSVNTTIEKTLNYYWKMRAIELIPLSSSAEMSREDLINLIDSLIDNYEIREIITKSMLSPYDNK